MQKVQYYMYLLNICFTFISILLLLTSFVIDWNLSSLFPIITALSAVVTFWFNPVFKDILQKWKDKNK